MKLEITNDDWEDVKVAIDAGGKIWDNELLKNFKKKIKEYNRFLQGEQCCYCRRSLADEFSMVIDIEHVLPKGMFKHHMFEILNLSVSCKRCNMEIKGEDISFITDVNDVNENPNDSKYYKIIHPNLDDYFSHIKYYVKIIDAKTIVKYKILNKGKGAFTYEYFELDEIERKSIDRAQGVSAAEKLSGKIPLKIAKDIRKLLGGT
ncbi:MAG TPA: HNH endonuclease [Bacteroidia bacterium]|jgi:uncharacterized protein (TIGR02646 family)|nr:HNH endonuclease [Bacteroidia bacterium]